MMKNKVKKILLFATLTFTLACDVKKKSGSDMVSELPKEIFQRWTLKYGMAYGEKISGLPESPVNDYEFKENGEYLLYNDDGTFMTGTWVYNSTDRMIYTKRGDGQLNGKISNLKTTSFTLIPAGKEVEGTMFEDFRFYYVPKEE